MSQLRSAQYITSGATTWSPASAPGFIELSQEGDADLIEELLGRSEGTTGL